MLTKEIKILMDQNHNEISLHTHQDCSNKKSENDRTVEDTEKSEPLYTPNRKRKCCIHPGTLSNPKISLHLLQFFSRNKGWQTMGEPSVSMTLLSCFPLQRYLLPCIWFLSFLCMFHIMTACTCIHK